MHIKRNINHFYCHMKPLQTKVALIEQSSMNRSYFFCFKNGFSVFLLPVQTTTASNPKWHLINYRPSHQNKQVKMNNWNEKFPITRRKKKEIKSQEWRSTNCLEIWKEGRAGLWSPEANIPKSLEWQNSFEVSIVKLIAWNRQKLLVMRMIKRNRWWSNSNQGIYSIFAQ